MSPSRHRPLVASRVRVVAATRNRVRHRPSGSWRVSGSVLTLPTTMSWARFMPVLSSIRVRDGRYCTRRHPHDRPHRRRQRDSASVGTTVGMVGADRLTHGGLERSGVRDRGRATARAARAAAGPQLAAAGGLLHPGVRRGLRADRAYGRRRHPVDPITVREELRKAGRIRRDGWPGMELIKMVESVPTPVSVGYYGRLVLEAALYRRVEQAGTRLVQAGRSRRGEVDDVFGLVRDECSELLATRRRYTEATATPPGRGGPARVAALSRDPAIPDAATRA